MESHLRNLEKNINRNVSLIVSIDSSSLSPSLSPSNRKRRACHSIISSIQSFLTYTDTDEKCQELDEVKEKYLDNKESDINQSSIFNDSLNIIRYGYKIVLGILQGDCDYFRKSLIKTLICLSSSSFTPDPQKLLYLELVLNVLPYTIPESSYNTSNPSKEYAIVQEIVVVFRTIIIECPKAIPHLIECLINLKKNFHENCANMNLLTNKEILEFCVESLTTMQEEVFGKILQTMLINVLSSNEEIISFYKMWKIEYEKRSKQKDDNSGAYSILSLAHEFIHSIALKSKLSICLEYLLQQIDSQNYYEDFFGLYVNRSKSMQAKQPFSWNVIDAMILVTFFNDTKYQIQIQNIIKNNIMIEFKRSNIGKSDDNFVSSLLDLFHHLLNMIKSEKSSLCNQIKYQLLSAIFEVCIFLLIATPSCHPYKRLSLPPTNIYTVSNLIRMLLDAGCDDLRSEVIQILLYWMFHACSEKESSTSFHPIYRKKSITCTGKLSSKRSNNGYFLSSHMISLISSQVLLHLACYIPCSFNEKCYVMLINKIFDDASNAYYSVYPIFMHQIGHILSFLLVSNNNSHKKKILQPCILFKKYQELVLSPDSLKNNLGLVLSTHLISNPEVLSNDEQKLFFHCIFKRINQSTCIDIIKYGCHFLHINSFNNASESFRIVKQLLVSTGLVQEFSQSLLHDSVVLWYTKNPFINKTMTSKRKIVFCLVDNRIDDHKQDSCTEVPFRTNENQENCHQKQSNPSPNSHASEIFCLFNTYLKLGRDVLKNQKNWSYQPWLLATLQLHQWPTSIESAFINLIDDRIDPVKHESNNKKFEVNSDNNSDRARIYEMNCIIPLLSSTINRQLICKQLLSSKRPLDSKTVKRLFEISHCCMLGISILSAVLNQSYCKKSISKEDHMHFFMFQLCKIYALKYSLEFCILLLKGNMSLCMTNIKQEDGNIELIENKHQSQSISWNIQHFEAFLGEQHLFMIDNSFLWDMFDYIVKAEDDIFFFTSRKDDISMDANLETKLYFQFALSEHISMRINNRYRLQDPNLSLNFYSANELYRNYEHSRLYFHGSLKSIKHSQIELSTSNVHTISLVITSTHTLLQLLVRVRHISHYSSGHTSETFPSSIVLATRCLSCHYSFIFYLFQLIVEDEYGLSTSDDCKKDNYFLKEFLSRCDGSIIKMMAQRLYDSQRPSSDVMTEFFKKDSFDSITNISFKEIKTLLSFFTNQLFDSCDNVALATQILDILSLIIFFPIVMMSSKNASYTSSVQGYTDVALLCYKNVCWKMIHTIYPQKTSDLFCVMAPILGHLRTIHRRAPYLWKLCSRYATVDGSEGRDGRVISLALRNLTREPISDSLYSLEVIFSYYSLLQYWSIVALILECDDTNHKDTIKEWDELIKIFVNYVSALSASKAKQQKNIVHRCRIPMITCHSFDKIFEILCNMTLASLSVSHIRIIKDEKSPPSLSKESVDSAERDNANNPYYLVTFYISCLIDLLQTYTSNHALFPSATCKFVLKSTLMLNKILVVVIQRCIKCRAVEPVLQQPCEENQNEAKSTTKKEPGHGSVFFLPSILDSVAFVVEILLNFCDFLVAQNDKKISPDSYSSDGTIKKPDDTLFTKETKLISMVQLRSEKLLEFLKNAYSMHNLPIPKKYFSNNKKYKQHMDNEIDRQLPIKRQKIEANADFTLNNDMPSSPSSRSENCSGSDEDSFYTDDFDYETDSSSSVEFEVIGNWG